MSAALYTLNSARTADGEVHARLSGEVDRSNASEVLRQLRSDAGPRRLLLDLSGLQHLDSSGMAMLNELARDLRLEVIIAAGSIVATAIAIAGLDELLSIQSQPANPA